MQVVSREKQLQGQMLTQRYFHTGAMYAHIHRYYYIHYTYIYIDMATQEERWERKKFSHASQIHAGNTIVVPQEKN